MQVPGLFQGNPGVAVQIVEGAQKRRRAVPVRPLAEQRHPREAPEREPRRVASQDGGELVYRLPEAFSSVSSTNRLSCASASSFAFPDSSSARRNRIQDVWGLCVGSDVFERSIHHQLRACAADTLGEGGDFGDLVFRASDVDAHRNRRPIGGHEAGRAALAAPKCSSGAYTGLAASSRHPRQKPANMEARVFL